jgi:hypothetical protein
MLSAAPCQYFEGGEGQISGEDEDIAFPVLAGGALAALSSRESGEAGVKQGEMS